MTPDLRPLVLVAALMSAAPAMAQTGSAADAQAAPPAVSLPPATAQPPAATLPNATPPPGPAALPAAPETVPGPDRRAEIQALRATFEALKQRDATATAQRQPAADLALGQLQQAEAALADLERQFQQAAWKASTLELFAGALAAAGPLALPEGLPAGLPVEIGLAVVEANATLYTQPQPGPEMVIRTLAEPTTMLRLSTLDAYTLLWSPQDGFAFALNMFRRAY